MTPTLIRTNSPLLLTTEGGEKMRVLFSKPARRSRNGFLLALGPIVDSAARRREMAAVALSGRWRSLSPFTYIIRTGEKKISAAWTLCTLQELNAEESRRQCCCHVLFTPRDPLLIFYPWTLRCAPTARARGRKERQSIILGDGEKYAFYHTLSGARARWKYLRRGRQAGGERERARTRLDY